MEIYIVKNGDTIDSIAGLFGVSVQRLILDNGLEQPGRLVPGLALIILKPSVIYTIKPGDTLFSIAESYDTEVNTLLRNNPQLALNENLFPGNTITISYTLNPVNTSLINGYAYPFISQNLIKRALPFLSRLTVFGYGFTEDGSLIEPDDMALVNLCISAGVTPVLLLSSITESGSFSSERASRLFNTPSLSESVLYSLVDIMQAKGYQGLDIDFEYVFAEDKTSFIDFVQRATDIMHENGFFVNVDLAPKTSVNQRGLLYEAHDYAALGAIADTVLLMTYEWGYAYGPPMAVAPIASVTRVVEFALSQIPGEKITLGIPNYGYDWTLPFQQGISRAVSISNQYAVSVAGYYNVPIEFDEFAQSPYFNYAAEGLSHIIWFEDVRSVDTKIRLMLDYNLRGIAYWSLMRPFAQNWSLLSISLLPDRENTF